MAGTVGEACKKCHARSEGSGCQETDCPQRAARMKMVADVATRAVANDPNAKMIGDFNFLNHIERQVGRVLTEAETERALRVKREYSPA